MGKPQKGKIAAVILISLLVVGFFLSIYLTVDEKIPGNAVVVITIEDKQYHSIHFDHICIAGKTAQTMSLSDAETREFKPHSYCEELGYFRGNRQFLFHHLLSKVGFPVNSRWDRNGNWLW